MKRSLDGAAVVIIGGSSGIGLATARLAQEQGARVTIVGRDKDRLASALDDLGAGVSGETFDVADEASVRAFFAAQDHVDHVVNLAGTHVNGPLADLDTADMRVPMDNRFFGPVHVFKYAPPQMSDGSITICTGVGVARPRRGGAIVSSAAGASEILAQGMALELAPIRVNVIRPGLIDTPLFDRMVGEHKTDFLAAQAKRIPLGRVGQPEDIAEGIAFLMTHPYVTGSTLTVDGGVSLG